jgi:hypothetical protein
MATTGRKETCPCGSGRQYERCCMIADVQGAGRIEILPVVSGREPAPDSRTFRSRMIGSDELRKLCGLSREDLYFLLYEPFTTPDLVTFDLELKGLPESQFFRIFRCLITGMGTQDLKATAKGNLPPRFVQETARHYYGEAGYLERKRFMTFRTETDFPVLHTVRQTAQLAGLVRKYRNRFHLTNTGREVLDRGLDGRVFLKLFAAYCTRFNWAYNDGYPDIGIVQQAFLFTLYLLSRYGDRFRPLSFYEDLFIAAFPEEIPEVPGSFGERRDEVLKNCYSLRSISRFAHFFGFADLNGLTDPEWSRKERPMIRKTDFLDAWVRFRNLLVKSIMFD